jgi:hypothetical protein
MKGKRAKQTKRGGRAYSMEWVVLQQCAHTSFSSSVRVRALAILLLCDAGCAVTRCQKNSQKKKKPNWKKDTTSRRSKLRKKKKEQTFGGGKDKGDFFFLKRKEESN